MREVRRLIRRYGPSEAPVLIIGETGTGKELVARALHEASRRRSGPLVPVNCAAVPSALFESEVFGSVRGAYTGAEGDRPGLVGAASGGTLFLDEVGDLPGEAQAKLLRLLEAGTYRPVGAAHEVEADLRILAAMNQDLEPAVDSGAFRLDLYYRLNVLRVHLPALRDRRADIPLLVDHFLRKHEASARRPTEEALAQLMAWSWPGNVRELEHAVQRSLLRGGSGALSEFELVQGPEPAAPRSGSEPPASELLLQLLSRHRGRLAPVAQALGVSIRTVQRRLRELNVRPRDFRS